LLGGIAVILIIGIPIVLQFLDGPRNEDDPWSKVPEHPSHTDHTDLIKGPIEDGPAATRECLRCHEGASQEVMSTAHWNWEGDPVLLPGRASPVRIGKKNLINNFCIGVQSNWYGCTSCHAGYGWEDASFDFTQQDKVDCLVCHDGSGSYRKSKGGYPAEGVDLLAVARSVASPSRETCGSCHFKGGGGDAVKHGDLDASLTHPRESTDVHMGRHGMTCVDCHRTEGHIIGGRSISVSADKANSIACTDCHIETPHEEERINLHTSSVSCQTCHIPIVALREATKVHWDWSDAGTDREEDPHTYLKKKGSFVYEQSLRPEYGWFNGTADRYLLGDRIDPNNPTKLNPPLGNIDDPAARIYPFKVHRGKQVYDLLNAYFLQPKTFGPGGYWETFDWESAIRLGSEATGLPYSGSFGFAATEMFWPLTHMVAPASEALQCEACHGEKGNFDWPTLGYLGDPIEWGGRGNSGSERTK
jgi:octaheme c-type cytochrome (tetrathionate reductase family)